MASVSRCSSGSSFAGGAGSSSARVQSTRASREAEQAVQALAVAQQLQLLAGEVQHRLGMDDLLARLLQLVDVAGRALLVGQRRRAERRVHDGLPKLHQPRRRLGRDDLLADLGRRLERLMGDAKQVRLELLARDPLSRRQHEQVQEVLHQRHLHVAARAVGRELHVTADGGVRQQARLDHVRLGDAELLVGVLQRGVVEESDRHRALARQASAQRLVEPPRDLLVLGAPLVPAGRHADAVLDDLADLRVPRGPRHRGAAGGGEQQQRNGTTHGANRIHGRSFWRWVPGCGDRFRCAADAWIGRGRSSSDGADG